MAEGRGRGGRGNLLEAYRKQMDEKLRQAAAAPGPVGRSAETVGVKPQSSEPEPPKPRGRAALTETLKRIQAEKKLGVKPPSEVGSSLASTTSTCTLETSMPGLDINVDLEDEHAIMYHGKSGTEVPATANYIQLDIEPDRGVYVYDVKFDPAVDAKQVRFKLINKMADIIGQVRVFNGTQLFLPGKLPKNVVEIKVDHPYDNTAITVKVTYIHKKSLGDSVTLYNILFKRIMDVLRFTLIGRNYFDPSSINCIPQLKLEVWPGYVTAVNNYEGGLMLMLDSSHKVLRSVNVLSLIQEKSRNPARMKQEVNQEVIGYSVLTRYNNKNYRIDDIMWDGSPKDTFEKVDGSRMSYIEYYKRQYNITITDHKQPLLIHRKKITIKSTNEKQDVLICLIPELCFVTGLSSQMRSDYKAMKEVSNFTRLTPNQRMNALRKYLENIRKSSDAQKILSDWGLKLRNATIDLNCRVLDNEVIMFGGGATVHGSPQADWTSACGKHNLLSVIDIQKWTILFTSHDQKYANGFVDNFMRVVPRMGIRASKPKMVCINGDRNDSYVDALRKEVHPNLQIIVIICPNARDDRYAVIKKMCCHSNPIPSQVINSRTLSNQAKQSGIVQKIAMQINCKLGGTLWSVRMPFTNWMICGVDVYHDKGANRSVLAFTASINPSVTQYFSCTEFHKDKDELSNYLKQCFMRGMNVYKSKNETYPTNVVIFRDGVGDGDMQYCRDHEVAQVKSCAADLGAQFNLSVIVVQKRINTRIYTANGTDYRNPLPGTIADRDITRRNFYDFFLVSQCVRFGTVSPTHYVVIFNESKINPDQMQRLTYKLCHLYYNWTGTVRIPAPCLYAHRLAYLIGQHVKITLDKFKYFDDYSILLP